MYLTIILLPVKQERGNHSHVKGYTVYWRECVSLHTLLLLRHRIVNLKSIFVLLLLLFY